MIVNTRLQHQFESAAGGVARRERQWQNRVRDAFSLIEVMVAVALLTVIVVGLLMMFNQTQRVFRASITQTDVLEGGRATMNMLAQELEQAAATHFNATNFLVVITTAPLLQVLPPQTANVRRTNVAEEVFFLTCVNQQWYATGYRVDPPGAGVGTLYRFYTNVPASRIWQAISDFFNTPPRTLSRVADGVVHFRVRACDLNGMVITNDIAVANSYGGVETNIFAWYNPPSGEFNYVFRSNALPVAVELELGILEPPALARFRAISNKPALARDFLSGRVGAVHLFRQRIPIRNVDPEAYR